MQRRQLLGAMIPVWVIVVLVIMIGEANAQEPDATQGCYTQELVELRYELVGEGDTGEWYETLQPAGAVYDRSPGTLWEWVGHYLWIIYAEEPFDEYGNPQHIASAAPDGPGVWRICTTWVPAGGSVGPVTLELLAPHPVAVESQGSGLEGSGLEGSGLEEVLVWIPM